VTRICKLGTTLAVGSNRRTLQRNSGTPRNIAEDGILRSITAVVTERGQFLRQLVSGTGRHDHSVQSGARWAWYCRLLQRSVSLGTVLNKQRHGALRWLEDSARRAESTLFAAEIKGWLHFRESC
jgi:hypothetical protein